MIELIDLTKKFATLPAVDNLNLKIPTGEIFGFLGPNGAGKTTTIKMMVGLFKPTRGTVVIDGKDIAKEPLEVKKIIGYIPDRSFLYEKLTAREFLRFVAGIYGFSKKECSDKINGLLRFFGLEEWGDELIESFSHGMRQRLVLSSALIHNPKATFFMMMLSSITIFFMTFAITSLGVGMGAINPRFKHTSSAEIPTGFGGLLYMIYAMGLIALTVVLEARPVYMLFSSYLKHTNPPVWFYGELGLAIFLIVLINIVALVFPMHWGLKNLRSMEGQG